MVVAPHVERFAWTIGVEDVDVEIPLHLFINSAHIPPLVSNDVVWNSVCVPYLSSDVGRVPLAPAKGSESNSYPF
jgi:hypothetical protein